MDEFLSLVGVQAMKYAVRSGIVLTSSYALNQMSRLAKSEDSRAAFREMKTLHDQFELKIKVITPAIDLIDLKSGRGNVFLESALPMTKALQHDIKALANRVHRSIQLGASEHPEAVNTEIVQKAMREEIKGITSDVQQMLARIDREIPLLQLAITASGETLSTTLPPSISPSRLLQASTLLTLGDIHFARDPSAAVQIGPMFYLSLYMLFQGHAPRVDQPSSDGERHTGAYGLGPSDRKPIWQEVVHKARVRLLRVASAFDDQHREFHYQLEVVEDHDDGRAHDEDFSTSSIDVINVTEVAKIFYTDTGRILNLGGDDDLCGSSPILLFKRTIRPNSNLTDAEKACCEEVAQVVDDQDAIDRQLLGEAHLRSHEDRRKGTRGSNLRQPESHLDPEWLAFEMYRHDGAESSSDSDSSSHDDASDDGSAETRTLGEEAEQQPLTRGNGQSSGLSSDLESLSLSSSSALVQDGWSRSPDGSGPKERPAAAPSTPLGAITTSLSLFEMLVRLAGLQECQQVSHLSIPDHLLAFFLEETSSTGLDGESRQRAQEDVRHKVGFDPSMESND